MWQKNLLMKYDRMSMNFYGWTRYILNRKYSDKINNGNDINNIKSSEDDIKKLLDDAASFNEAQDSSWSSSVYPENAAILQETPTKPIQDPSTSAIILFPGQGVLKVGKVNDYLKIPRAKEVFDIANEILGFSLLNICQKGPPSKLNRTEFNQIATVATSIAALEKLWEERPTVIDQCKGVAGYSVGELTALIFSGAITLEDGIRLAAIRGAAMQQASDAVPQGMLIIHCSYRTKIGEILEKAKKWAMDVGVSEPVCAVAIYLYTETKILAGSIEALEYIEKNYKNLHIRRTQRLSVSGAFHTSLMSPAIKSFKKALDKVHIEKPRIDTYSNITAKCYRSVEQIKKSLIKQITSPVRWEQTLHSIYGRKPGVNFPRTFVLGADNSMKIILERTNLKASQSCTTI